MRGAAWLAEVIQAEAEKHEYDESAIMAGLAELDAMREADELSEEELEDAENELLERLIAIRGLSEQEETNGGA